MVILRVDAVRRPVRFLLADAGVKRGSRLADRLGGPDIAMVNIDQGPAGEIAIHHHFEDIVVQVCAREVPVIIVGLVEEVEAVETLDPAHLDLDVHVLRVVGHAMAVFGVHELVHAAGVAFGDHGPIFDVAVDAWDL